VTNAMEDDGATMDQERVSAAARAR
jgi:hypothetical protein